MNQLAVDFVKEFEGCRLEAYKDGGGVWTIGYGATGPDIKLGLVWTQAQAEARLGSDLLKAQTGVLSLVKVALTSKQLAALTSFTFNCGKEALAQSEVLDHVNSKEWLAAAKAFEHWDHDNGVEVKGLLIRRMSEGILFLQGS